MRNAVCMKQTMVLGGSGATEGGHWGGHAAQRSLAMRAVPSCLRPIALHLSGGFWAPRGHTRLGGLFAVEFSVVHGIFCLNRL